MQSYLMHYGVKGMKWGVRRDRAVASAFASRRAEEARRSASTYRDLIKQSPKLGTSKELHQRIRDGERAAKMYEKLAGTYASGLSAKDIARGQKKVNKLFSGMKSVDAYGRKGVRAREKARAYVHRANLSLDRIPQEFINKEGRYDYDEQI